MNALRPKNQFTILIAVFGLYMIVGPAAQAQAAGFQLSRHESLSIHSPGTAVQGVFTPFFMTGAVPGIFVLENPHFETQFSIQSFIAVTPRDHFFFSGLSPPLSFFV